MTRLFCLHEFWILPGYRIYFKRSKPTWPTAFEKSKIYQPNFEKLQFKESKICAFLLIFQHFSQNQAQNTQILLSLNYNSQDWVNYFLISRRPWVRKAWEYILMPNKIHNWWKQKSCVTKTPKTHLLLYSHLTVTVLLALLTNVFSMDYNSNFLNTGNII